MPNTSNILVIIVLVLFAAIFVPVVIQETSSSEQISETYTLGENDMEKLHGINNTIETKNYSISNTYTTDSDFANATTIDNLTIEGSGEDAFLQTNMKEVIETYSHAEDFTFFDQSIDYPDSPWRIVLQDTEPYSVGFDLHHVPSGDSLFISLDPGETRCTDRNFPDPLGGLDYCVTAEEVEQDAHNATIRIEYDRTTTTNTSVSNSRYISQNHTISNGQESVVTISLSNSSASIRIEADTNQNGNFDTIANQTTVTESGNHSLTIDSTTANNWRTNITFTSLGENSSSKLHSESIIFNSVNPPSNSDTTNTTIGSAFTVSNSGSYSELLREGEISHFSMGENNTSIVNNFDVRLTGIPNNEQVSFEVSYIIESPLFEKLLSYVPFLFILAIVIIIFFLSFSDNQKL